MALFDTIRCDYPLPDPRLQGAEFQTKDLGEALCRYTITREGRLIRHQLGSDLGTAANRSAARTDNEPGEEIPFHGDIRIYANDTAGELMEYRVRFTHGQVEWIRPDSGMTDKDATPTLAVLADVAERLAVERRATELALFRELERLDPEMARQAIQVFDDRHRAAAWLTRPNRALGNVSPYRTLAQGDRQKVLDVLGRIQQGTFS